jgi:hypothetical protein
VSRDEIAMIEMDSATSVTCAPAKITSQPISELSSIPAETSGIATLTV